MAFVMVVTAVVLAGIVVISSTRSTPNLGATSSIPTTTPTSTELAVRRVTKLADHPLLVPGAALLDATCTLPAFVRNAQALLPFYEELIRRMDLAWAPVLDAARLPHKLPYVNVQEHPGETGCGDLDEVGDVHDLIALYCPAIDTMYLPTDRMLAADDGRPANHLAIFAHEFAHHVQEESGLLWAAHEAMRQADWATAQGLETSRRLELQANCFAGLMIAAAADHGSISRDLANEAMEFFRFGSSPSTHGSVNQSRWAMDGFEQRTTAACDTFAAPAGEVN